MFKDQLLETINKINLSLETKELLLEFVQSQKEDISLETGTFILGIIKTLNELPMLKAKAKMFDEIAKLQEQTENEITGYEKQIEQLELAIDPPQVG